MTHDDYLRIWVVSLHFYASSLLVNCLWYKRSLYSSHSIFSIPFHLQLMQFLSISFLFSLFILPSLADDVCFSCASPQLEENWEVTNLPTKPQGLVFTDDCSSDTNTELKKPCGQGVCYEALIPLNNRALYLRGCYADFMEETNITRASAANGICDYGLMGKDTFEDDSSKNPVKGPKPAYAATRWCVNPADGEMCNSQLKYSADLFANPSNYFKRCTNPGVSPDKQCIDCSHFGGNGDCNADTKTYCRGPYCVKYEGYLNGDAMAVRTCAPATPFSGDQCAWMESTSDFNLFGVTLKLPYKAWHCYCTGDSCNPSSMVSSSLLFSIVLPLFLTRFIPFFSS